MVTACLIYLSMGFGMILGVFITCLLVVSKKGQDNGKQ